MGGIWAVTRHTFAHCLRMKVAVAFIIMLAIVLTVMPIVAEGDGTLAGRIRTFLEYGTALTSLLLSIVTVFLSIFVVTSDIDHRRIFIVASKPIPRWQYVLGRWAGVVVFDVVLLACSGAVIYGFAQYLRGQPALNPSDRRAVETEVFTARNRVHPAPPDVASAVKERIARLKEEGSFSRAIEAYKIQTNGDEAKAELMLLNQVRSEVKSRLQSVGVGESFLWKFEGIDLAEAKQVRGAGEITALNTEVGLMRITAPPEVLAGLIVGGPVVVSGIDTRVNRLEKDFVDVRFDAEGARQLSVASLSVGSKVTVTVDPIIQITYKASPASVPVDKLLPSIWEMQNPKTGFFHQEFRRDRAYSPATFAVSARLVDDQGRAEVRYLNVPFAPTGQGSSVTILTSDVSILYRVGGFEGNLARALALILLQLMFLAAMGVFWSTFVSFRVACLVTLIAIPLGKAMSFMTMATTFSPIERDPVTKQIGAYALAVIKVLLADLSRTSPSEYLVGGMNIAWDTLASAALMTVAVRGALFLAAACVIFSKRELASVQV